MTLNLIAWNEDIMALASDQRVVQLRGGQVTVADDTRVKLVLLDCAWPGRFGWSFNGLAEVDGLETTAWLAQALTELGAPNESIEDACADLAERASSTKAFRRLDRVHTFLLAGWREGRPLVGLVHNGDSPGGIGVRRDRFMVELTPDRLPGALVSGMDEALTHEEMNALVDMVQKRPILDDLQGRLEHLIRLASGRPASRGVIGQGVVSMFIPRDGSAVQERTHYPGWQTARIELPMEVGPRGAIGVTLELGQTIEFQTPEEQRWSRRTKG